MNVNSDSFTIIVKMSVMVRAVPNPSLSSPPFPFMMDVTVVTLYD